MKRTAASAPAPHPRATQAQPLCGGPLARWIVVVLCLLSLGTSHAHSSGNSYLELTWRDSQAILRVDLSIRDLDFVHDLDSDRDGQVTWSEVQAREAALRAWIAQGLSVRTPQAPCALVALPVMASERSDGHYLSTEWRLDCPGTETSLPAGSTLKYSLMFAEDHLHRGLLRIDLPSLQSSAILSPDRPDVVLVPAESDPGSVLWHYGVEGIWHIWIGADHILFLLSLLVLAPLAPSRVSLLNWPAREQVGSVLRDVLTVVTAFTVAHSITLSLTVLGWVTPPAGVVEPVIAASVVLAALNNLLGWFSFQRWRLAFLFGLIHGFGFASVLVDLGLPSQALALALGGFNVGVELGQLAIVAAYLALAWWLRHTALYRWVVVVGGSIAIALTGALWTWARLGV